MNNSTDSSFRLEQAGETATLQEHQAALYRLLCEFDRICEQLQLPYYLLGGTLLGAVRHQGFIPWDDDLDVLMMRKDYDRFMREAPALLNEACFLQSAFSEHWPLCFSKLRLNGTTCLEEYHPKDAKVHQGVYIDIFPGDNACGSSLGRHFQHFCSRVVIAKGLDRRGYETSSLIRKVFILLCRPLPQRFFLRAAKGPKKTGKYVHTFLGSPGGCARNLFPAECFRETVRLKFEDGYYPAPVDYDKVLTANYGDYMQLPPPEERKSAQHAILIDLTRSYEDFAHYRDGMKFDAYKK